MFAGAALYDEAELRRVMNGQFRADAVDVLASLASREAAQGKFARLRRERAGRHDVFAN